MATAARESRRTFALDVRTLVWQETRFDSDRFVRTGNLIEWGQYEPPDTPSMRAAKAAVEEERKMHEEAGRG